MNGNVLMLMIEPTPYILGFVRELKSIWKGTVEVAFVGRNLSQPWTECGVEDKVLPAGFVSAARELWACLKRGRYALVHLAGWSQPLIFLALVICALRGIPATVESDTPYRDEAAGWRPWLKRLLYPMLFRLPRLFLPGGSRQAAYFRSYGVPEERIRVAQMTVDIEAIRAYQADLSPERRSLLREKAGFSAAQGVFLYVGRLESYKGILDLLDAYQLVKHQREDEDSALLIVGDGSCRAVVEEAAGRLPGVVVAGRLTGSDLFNAYAAADILVLPSPTDNWGLVVNEAMAFGLPVIVTDAVGCVDDLVDPDGTGLIVPPANPAALAEAMCRLAGDRAFRHACGAAALERIRPWTLRNEAEQVTRGWLEVQRA